MNDVCFYVGDAEPHQAGTLGIIQNGQHELELTTNHGLHHYEGWKKI